MARAKKSDLTKDMTVNLTDIPGVTLLQDSKWATVDDRLPTFLPELDQIMGGGVPFGRLTEIMGKNASGKSTLATLLMKSAVTLGVTTVLIDTEGTADPERLGELGLDMSGIYQVKPPESKRGEKKKEDAMSVEYVAEKCEALIKAFAKTDDRLLIVWDSIAQTAAEAELEKGVGNKQPGIKAKAMSQFIQIIAPMVTDSNVAFVGINQARDEMGSMFGGVDSPGGHALHHWASLRLEVNKSTQIKEKTDSAVPGAKDVEEYIGHEMRVKTIKSKVSRPNQQSISYLLADSGLDYEENIYRSAKDRYNLITTGTWGVYIADDGQEYKYQKKTWVPFLKSPAGEAVRKELFQKMMLISFPDGFKPLNNAVIDVEKFPDMKGMRKIYKERAKINKLEENTTTNEDVEKALAELT